MDAENETRADSELPTEEERHKTESDHDTDEVNVKNVESNEQTVKTPQDSVPVESAETLSEKKDDEKGLSNVVCESVQEQTGEEETKESQDCDDAAKSVSEDSHPDPVESMQVDTFEQAEQENLPKTQIDEGSSIISKDLDGISDVDSQDPLDQPLKKTDNIDSESILNADGVSSSDGTLDGSKVNPRENNLDENSVENKNDEATESAIANSPEAMDVSNTDKDNEPEIENDDLSNPGKSSATQFDEQGDKSPVNSDQVSDSGEKESASGKSSHEEVNTEFVQIISQEKQDDSQIENNSIIDAEDPFGGDNLVNENSEQSETDAISKSKANFEKMGDKADNLQDVISTKEVEMETVGNEEKTTSGDEKSPEKSRENDVLSATVSEDTESAAVNESEKTDDKTETNSESKTADSDEKKDKADDKDSEKEKEKTNIETESSVLPGQDDELCIIPDSMKDVDESEKVAEVTPAEEAEKSSDKSAQKTTEKTKTTPATDAKETPVVDEIIDPETVVRKELPNVQTVTNVTQSITDVIDLEDDSEKPSEVEEIQAKETCKQCNQLKVCKIKVKVGSDLFSVCSKACKSAFKSANNKAMDIPSDGVNSKREKRCASCLLIIEGNDERCLSWETMEFCNEECLGKFQTKYGSYCRNCNGSVQPVSLGKYCVRFGYDVRQFCCSVCLEEFKKGLKVCTYCQKDISAGTEGFLAPVGDKGQFKDFCTQDCMEKYSRMSSTEPPIAEKKACSVCQEEKLVHCEVQIDRAAPVAICSDPCFAAFKFVNKVDPDQCSTCKKFFELPNKKSFVVFYENDAHTFCTKTCLNIFIITNRKIVPCSWCKVKKYNFDMIKKELKTGQVMMMCSLNCLTLYQVSINAVSARRIKCDYCKEVSQAQYHLTMSDATIRNFCSYNCVMNFQGQYTKSPITIPTSDDHPVPTGVPKRTIPHRSIAPTPPKPVEIQAKKIMPVISSVTSLATIGNGQVSPTTQSNSVANATVVPPLTVQAVSGPPQIIYKQQVITRPTSPVKIHNKSTQCKPLVHTKGVSVRPHPCTKSTQTDEILKTVIPIPVPIYVPFPLYMYNMPFPVPTPIPIPIPVPIFVPTTRNSAKGIMKDIKRIQEKIPSDPFEAELLMMAEMVATDKKTTDSDSDSVEDNREEAGDDPSNTNADSYNAEDADSNNTFSEDMFQMALKMATGELDEPAVDLETALTPNKITPSQSQTPNDVSTENDAPPERLSSTRGRKRVVPSKPRTAPSKRGRRSSSTNDVSLVQRPEQQASQQPRFNEPAEKPDANMALKYTFGVNAWRHWVVTKNAELEKQNTSTRKVKLFKTDLLQLTADELNYSLVLFIQEVRKPNGAEYAPDTIYYLCLGIQQYLFENNRIDNIFTDSYYEQFTDNLNEIAKKFSVLYNDAQYIVTRVEEEHLWESKQLGAHSPHVLLSTLMFFNTKHFNLVTVEEHMQLSFSHIMKHWKRNPAAQPSSIAGKVPGSRNVLLRFYPPQSALEANSRKKKVYEQQENEDNPLRCPVKLYEFYLSKCPESVKTRNDVFYLLPERSCVPDSPVWYSTSALAKEHLVKMLHRIKMVKEINIALLNS